MNADQEVTIEVVVDAPMEKVWQAWTGPEHIVKWNQASDDWHTTSAENDLKVGGQFSSRMESKDGSMGFDFWGTYTELVKFQRIAYTMGDERKAVIEFSESMGQTKVVETFEAETQNPIEMQRNGRQAILDSFKRYVEGLD
jgi:uncharacterized protein YndB with AHSA1/START domain